MRLTTTKTSISPAGEYVVPGAISFILDTDRRLVGAKRSSNPCPSKIPVCIESTTQANLKSSRQCRKFNELQEALYHDFQIFIDKLFHAKALTNHLGTIPEYERLLHSLFTRSPRQIMRLLLTLHEASVNCDHWNPALLEGVFKHFLVVLRLLSEVVHRFCRCRRLPPGRFRRNLRHHGLWTKIHHHHSQSPSSLGKHD